MGETTKKETNLEKQPKKNVWKVLKAEFKKIIWPDKLSLKKKTMAAIVVSVCLGALIALIDYIFKTGINLIIQ